MTIGNTNISRDMMPSFVKPEDLSTHLYSSAQDTLNQMLGMAAPVQQAPFQPMQGNITNASEQPNSWMDTGSK